MCIRFHRQPYQYLYSWVTNPHLRLAIDMIVFKIGYKREQEEELKKLEIQAGASLTKKAAKQIAG